MHITLKNDAPELIGAAEGAKLLSCEIKFPVHPVTKQLMGPGEAFIRYSMPSGDEYLKGVPFKVES
jgi:hypothetical protein